jgi:hypothetical protein
MPQSPEGVGAAMLAPSLPTETGIGGRAADTPATTTPTPRR